MERRPFIVGVGGFASGVGKTTLMCDLLRRLPRWEAIKTTRGHYRSCGKDPHACCVSDLLGESPVVRSGRELTYETGKDTGRYWDAGAANVHWVIASDEQVQDGIKRALDRVEAVGVLVEGNSFSEYVPVDFFVMVAGDSTQPIKRSARRALTRASSIYKWGGVATPLDEQLARTTTNNQALPIYTSRDLPKLVADITSVLSNASK